MLEGNKSRGAEPTKKTLQLMEAEQLIANHRKEILADVRQELNALKKQAEADFKKLEAAMPNLKMSKKEKEKLEAEQKKAAAKGGKGGMKIDPRTGKPKKGTDVSGSDN